MLLKEWCEKYHERGAEAPTAVTDKNYVSLMFSPPMTADKQDYLMARMDLLRLDDFRIVEHCGPLYWLQKIEKSGDVPDIQGKDEEAWKYATQAQGFSADFAAWQGLDDDERAEYENGAAGIPTA